MRRQVRRQVPPRSLHLRLRKRDSASRQSEHWHRRPSRSLVSRLRRHSTSNPIRRATSGMATSTPNNNARHLRRSAHHTLLRRRSTSGSRGIIHRSSRIGRSSTNITSHYRRTSFSRQSISRLPPPPPPPLRAKLHAVLPRRSAAPWSSCSSLEAEQQRPRPRRLSSSQHSRRRSSWRRSRRSRRRRSCSTSWHSHHSNQCRRHFNSNLCRRRLFKHQLLPLRRHPPPPRPIAQWPAAALWLRARRFRLAQRSWVVAALPPPASAPLSAPVALAAAPVAEEEGA